MLFYKSCNDGAWVYQHNKSPPLSVIINDNLKNHFMKHSFFFPLAMAMCACQSDPVLDGSAIEEPVTITFTPYDMEPLTRTATSISNYCSHLDVWLSDGTTTTSVHQGSADAAFGSVSLTLNKTKTYTLYAVAHKCATDATLADGIISFPDDKVTQTLWYTTTFSPATTTNVNALMQRIVADFRLDITDEIPAAVKKLRFTVSEVFDRWSVTDGGTHSLNRVSTINYGGTSAIFNVYAIVTDAQTTHDITVEALTESDAVIQLRQFPSVPLRNGYKTTYRGQFFTDAAFTSTFTANDWYEYDVVDF